MTSPAKSMPWSLRYWEVMERFAKPSGSVRTLSPASPLVNMKAKKYSFHTPMNWKIATVTKPGRVSGSITRQNAAASEQPSITAAS